LFATHPSLIKRLKAIDPRFDAREFEQARQQLAARSVNESDRAPVQPAPSAKIEDLISLPATAPGMVAGLVGNPGAAHMQRARQIRESLPEVVTQAGIHPESACALLLGLALDLHRDVRERQKLFISQQVSAADLTAIEDLQPAIDALAPEQRVPALLLAFPALRQLTRETRLQLLSTLHGMLQREGRMSLHSYVLRKLAQVHLRDEFDPAARLQRKPLSAVQPDVQVLFSVLAQHGHHDEASARRAYEIGAHHLYPRERPPYAVSANWAGPLDVALTRLDQLAPVAKEQLVEAMVKTVMHDQVLTLGEAELLRTLCASLHCPLPPLATRQDAVGCRV
jgi:hypothetical protein